MRPSWPPGPGLLAVTRGALLLQWPSHPLLARALVAVLLLLGTRLLDDDALSDPTTYVLAVILGVGFALTTAWRRRRSDRTQ